jgi:putative flippase GtrA
MSVTSVVSFVASVSFALTRMQRQRVFLAVGGLGFLVQLGALAALMSLAHWSWLPATLVSVELAVVHNFVWHERWTWGDRTVAPSHLAPSHLGLLKRLARFHVANGAVSIVGNAALMTLFVGVLGLPAIPANALAVAAMSVVNFVMADRWVFAARLRRGPTYASTLLALAIPIHASAAPAAVTLSAWERHVAATEARLERTRTSAARGERSKDAIAASGESLQVPSGTISDWRGSVFIPGVTLDRLLDRLQHPGTPPPQEDVVSSRVIARSRDSLSVAIRLVRRAIVTVSYDTEHEMRFRRWSPTLATARSVATRIDEVDGGDHGFLWRLHSYWRYEETDAGVQVELESLTLSRDVPSLVRPIAAPLVHRIARESMIRTLEALRQFMVSGATTPTRARGLGTGGLGDWGTGD